MRDWEPMDPREARGIRLEESILAAVLLSLAGMNLLEWII